MKPDACDIIIAGGGLNGLAAAVAMAGNQVRVPLSVTLVDEGDPLADKTSAHDGRASAITASSRRMLAALGVWPALAGDAQPMTRIDVTNSKLGDLARPVMLQFGAEESGPEPSAWMVENRHLLHALKEQVAASPHIRVVGGARIGRFSFDGPLALAEISDAGPVPAPLIVAADGRSSPARAAADIDVIGWTYAQSGIVLTVRHERPHNGIAREHFLAGGPFAILPLKGDRSSLVWTEPADEAERLMALASDQFAGELERRFGVELGTVEAETDPQSFPLSVQIAQSFFGERLALVGDAAHVIHPIAGLGFNLGLRDIAALAECVSDAVRRGQDHGSQTVLERYQSWRRADTYMTAAVTDGLNRLFSNDSEALRRIRHFGLGLVDQAGGLKSLLMANATGPAGAQPRLLTGQTL